MRSIFSLFFTNRKRDSFSTVWLNLGTVNLTHLMSLSMTRSKAKFLDQYRAPLYKRLPFLSISPLRLLNTETKIFWKTCRFKWKQFSIEDLTKRNSRERRSDDLKLMLMFPEGTFFQVQVSYLIEGGSSLSVIVKLPIDYSLPINDRTINDRTQREKY